MQTLQALLIVLLVLLIGLVLFYIALSYAQKVSHRRVSVRTMFYGFRQKIWMTAGLGLMFSGLYLLVVYLASFVGSEARMNLFFMAYKHPTMFIYLGLLIFVCISMGIIFARTVIKYLYNKNNRDKKL